MRAIPIDMSTADEYHGDRLPYFSVGLLLIPDIAWGSILRLIPARVWAIDAVCTLVTAVVATPLGAWVYKEQQP